MPFYDAYSKRVQIFHLLGACPNKAELCPIDVAYPKQQNYAIHLRPVPKGPKYHIYINNCPEKELSI